MKIGIYAFWSLSWDGNSVRGLGCHIRYLKYFLKYTDGVRLFTTVKNRDTNIESLSDPKLDVVAIPWDSWANAWLHRKDLKCLLAENLEGIAAIYVRLFDPCTWVLASLCEQKGIPLVFHIVGDPIEGIFQRQDWSLLGKWIRRVMFYPEEFLVRRITQRHVTLINGSHNAELFRKRGMPGEVVISSTLEDTDFFKRQDTCSEEEVIVLYAGFLRPAKQIEVLVKAVSLLKLAGQKIRLRLVGPFEGHDYQKMLKQLISRLCLFDCVDLVGFVPAGGPLNQEFRSADIFAFPSATEGSPRVLLEAAANCLPIVTTNVGSVQDLFIDGENSLIVPLNQPEATASAISRYIKDPYLRRRCIRNAYEIAQKHSCDSFIKYIVQSLHRPNKISHRSLGYNKCNEA